MLAWESGAPRKRHVSRAINAIHVKPKLSPSMTLNQISQWLLHSLLNAMTET